MTLFSCRVTGVFVVVNEQCTSPVVILGLPDDDRCIPIYIGLWEAISIHNAIRKEIPPRPLTHDLFVDFLRRFGISLQSLTVDALENGVYYGKLLLRGPEREEVMDCRPSDGIALATRWNAEILLEPQVVESCAVRKGDLPELIDLSSYLYG